MSHAKNAAEQAFIAAKNDLEIALEKFNIARDELTKITGEFISTGYPVVNLSGKFSPASNDAGSYLKTEF